MWFTRKYFLKNVTNPRYTLRNFQRKADCMTYYLYGVNLPAVFGAGFALTLGPKRLGLTLLVAAWRRQVTPEILVLAVCCAAGLTAIDVIYVARGVIAPIYLADAAAEGVLIVAWAFVLLRGARS